jgi:hypothetical protein
MESQQKALVLETDLATARLQNSQLATQVVELLVGGGIVALWPPGPLRYMHILPADIMFQLVLSASVP